MLPKLFKTNSAIYVQATWNGKNESGWEAFSDHCIVLPDHVASRSAGGVELPQDSVDRMTMAAEAGVIVSIGDGAFQYHQNGMPWIGKKPKPGDRVSVGRYSGQLLKGHDNVDYRILSDSEIGAIHG